MDMDMLIKKRKIAILGYPTVGKSALCIQYVFSEFIESYEPTVEISYMKNVKIDNEDYELTLIDTTGQDEYYILPESYIVKVHGFLMVYSTTSRKSFEVLKIIYDKLLNMGGNLKIPIILVGNKSDLNMERVVTEEEGRNLANLWKVEFFEVSAKQSERVSDIIYKMVMVIDQHYFKGPIINRKNRVNCSIL